MDIIGSWCAHPFAYNYSRSLWFHEDNEFEAYSWLGQAPQIHLRAKFEVDVNALALRLTSLRTVNPIDEDEVWETLTDKTIPFSFVVEDVAMRDEACQPIHSAKDWPARIYKRRIEFQDDPIVVLSGLPESNDFPKSEGVFYSTQDCEKINLEEMRKLQCRVFDLYEGQDPLAPSPLDGPWLKLKRLFSR